MSTKVATRIVLCLTLSFCQINLASSWGNWNNVAINDLPAETKKKMDDFHSNCAFLQQTLKTYDKDLGHLTEAMAEKERKEREKQEQESNAKQQERKIQAAKDDAAHAENLKKLEIQKERAHADGEKAAQEAALRVKQQEAHNINLQHDRNKQIEDYRVQQAINTAKAVREQQLIAEENATKQREIRMKLDAQERAQKAEEDKKAAEEAMEREIKKIEAQGKAEAAKSAAVEKAKQDAFLQDPDVYTDAEIKKAKELKDINLEQLKESEKIKAQGAVNVMAKKLEGIQDLLKNKKAMGTVVVASSGVLAAWYGWPIVFAEIERRFIKPVLVDETSRFTWDWDSFCKKFWSPKKSFYTPKIILPADIAQQLQRVIASTKNTKKHKGNFSNVLLWGPPGTGKTMFAKMIAKESGMDYAIVTGASFYQFLKAVNEGVTAIKELFRWAPLTKKGMILFIDEADVFLENRATILHEMIAMLNEFLAQTGTESPNIMIILATNRPKVLDPAIDSRIGESVEFRAPGKAELEAMIKQYVKYTITHNPELKKLKRLDVSILQDDQLIADIAARLEKYQFSGRDIRNFINIVRDALFANHELVLSHELLERVIQGQIKKKGEENKKLHDVAIEDAKKDARDKPHNVILHDVPVAAAT